MGLPMSKYATFESSGEDRRLLVEIDPFNSVFVWSS